MTVRLAVGRSDSFRQPCNYIGTPPDYQSVCVQKEMEHRLTTIESDPSTGSVSTSVDLFRFPSYCACKLVKGSRSGAASLCGTPPMLSSPIMYGPVSYGADEGTGSEKKSTRPGVTRQPLPGQQRPLQLSSRTMDLFG
jgi:Spaetzle